MKISALAPLLCLLTIRLCVAGPGDTPHPFILWTTNDAMAINQRIQTDPGTKTQVNRMATMEGGAMGVGSANNTLYNLFKFTVLGDGLAGEIEKANLLAACPTNAGTNTGDAADPATQALRYDSLYELLEAAQRKAVQTNFSTQVRDFLDSAATSGSNWFDRATWRPSQSWSRAAGIHLMAAALRDESLVERVFNSNCGMKRFFDRYLADAKFCVEGFETINASLGPMIWYCNSLDRLGLGRFGWDYTGTGGAGMRRLLHMLPDVAYPRTDIPGGMPNWRIVTMGEAKSREYIGRGVSEQFMIAGCLPDGTGGDRWWTTPATPSATPHAMPALWMEWAHSRFPGDGFDYFLAQMRGPAEKTFFPSLYAGIKSFDVASVKPPAPCASYLAVDRGFAFLRADETAAYWEAPAPALAQQFGMYYGGYAHDCFSILGYQAFNRPIYMNAGFGAVANHVINDQIRSGRSVSAISRHPWNDTVRGHAGVVVDNFQARPVDRGNDGLRKHRMRFASYPAVKFVCGRASGIYPAVTMERAHFLTREYDFDVFRLTSGMPHRYEWHVHGPGQHNFDDAWKPTSELNGSMLYREVHATQPPEYSDKRDGNDLAEVRKLEPDAASWSATIIQSYSGTNSPASRVGKAWYDRGIGVRVLMLGETGTTVFAGRTPGSLDSEFGGTTLMARRDAESTVFGALHEPFVGGLGQHKVLRFTRLAESTNGIAVAVVGAPDSGINDRIILRYGKIVDTPSTFEGDGESFAVTDHAWIRIGRDAVDAWGVVNGLAVKVQGSPTFRTNGVDAAASVSGGVLQFGTQGASLPK